MGHTYTSLLTHVVFSTKDRYPSLDKPISEEVEKFICGVVANLRAKTLVECDERTIWT